MNKAALLRNLEDIQEDEPGRRGVRAGTLLLASLGGACVVFAVLSHARRKAPTLVQPNDPLGALMAQGASTVSMELGGKDVTFPSMLSDAPRATTALAAVRLGPTGPARSLVAPERTAEANTAPPPATDRLITMALPSKAPPAAPLGLGRPQDVLAQLAKQAAAPTGPSAEQGNAGGYQLQASSFRDEPEAQQFATALRQHGHRAYVETAQLLGRGTWYRVRVGPFKSQREALTYRAEFEKRERLAPFLVEPPKDRPASTKTP
jgi:DedD protein